MNILNIPIDVIGYMSEYLPEADLLSFAITHRDWLGLLKTRNWRLLIAHLAPEKILPHIRHNIGSYLRARKATDILNKIYGKRYYNYNIDGDKIHKVALASVSDSVACLYLDTNKLESVYGSGHHDIRMTLRFESTTYRMHLTLKGITDLLWYVCYFHPETIGYSSA